MDNSSRDKNSNSGIPTLVDGRIQDVATSVHGAVDQAAQFGHLAVEKVASVATPTEAWINEQSQALMDVRRNTLSATRQYIVTHPLQSICMALAAGLLIGRLRS